MDKIITEEEKSLYKQLRYIEDKLAALRIERMKLLDKQWDADNRQGKYNNGNNNNTSPPND